MFKLHLFLMRLICILAKINFTFAQPVLAWDQFNKIICAPILYPFLKIILILMLKLNWAKSCFSNRAYRLLAHNLVQHATTQVLIGKTVWLRERGMGIKN